MINLTEFMDKLTKYLLLGGAMVVCNVILKRGKPDMSEALIMALVASSIFAILDTFAPDVGRSAKQGAGFAIGATVAGGLPMVK